MFHQLRPYEDRCFHLKAKEPVVKRCVMCRCVTPFPKFLYKSLFVILPVCLILNHVTICNTRTYKSLKVISSHTTSKELKKSFVFNFQCLFVGSVSIHT